MRSIFTAFSLFFSISSFSQIYVDTVTFEIPESAIRLDTSVGNTWQVGKPLKNFFDSSYSAHRAIVTDTINSYSSKDTSRFTFTFKNTSMSCANCLRFWHKYDTDTLKDNCYLDGSYDNGASWVVLQDTVINNWSGLFLWNYDYHLSSNSFTPHDLYMSGTSDGWIQSEFCWKWWLPVKMDTIILNPDSMIVRFNFTADTIDNQREGWMIDDILLIEADVSQCSGIQEYLEENTVSAYPNPASKQLYIEVKNPALKPETISVYNLLSQRVIYSRIQFKNSPISLNIESLERGIYFMVLLDKAGNPYTKKFVKE